MATNKKWKNKKYKLTYIGKIRYVGADKDFTLSPIGGGKTLSFESFHAAKRDGWNTVKNAKA